MPVTEAPQNLTKKENTNQSISSLSDSAGPKSEAQAIEDNRPQVANNQLLKNMAGSAENTNEKEPNKAVSSKIDLHGELTTTAKLNRFFGMESTYSKLMAKVQSFNAASQIEQKRDFAKDVIGLAQEWNTKHGKTDKEDENEKAKQNSVNKLIGKKLSNYPIIIKQLEKTKKLVQTLEKDLLADRSSFKIIVNEYDEFKKLISDFKKESNDNLLYHEEHSLIEASESLIVKSNSISLQSFDTEKGFKVVGNSISYNIDSGKLELEGSLAINFKEITDISGKVTFEFDKAKDFKDIKNIEITGGSCWAKIAGLEVFLDKIEFSSEGKQFHASEATASLDILGEKIKLTVEGPVINSVGFDYSSISGKFSGIEYGFIKLNESELSYNKKKKELTIKTSYEINDASALGLSDLKTKGEVEITWNKAAGVSLILKNGSLSFEIFKQKAEAKDLKIDTKEKSLQAGNFDLDLDFGDKFKRKFVGKDVQLKKGEIDFSKLSMEASGDELDFKVLKLKPSEYSIIKVGEGGYALKADGSVELTLPEVLGVKSSGGMKGDVSFNFKNKTPDYNIKGGGAKIQVPNPLYEIASLLGQKGGASADFELGGTIPIFTGISAVFGVYLKLAAAFGKTIDATIDYNQEKNLVEFNISTGVDANIEAGAFIGVKAGYDIIISIQARLEAGGAMKVTGNFGYGKGFLMDEKPEAIDKIDKAKEGLNFNMAGDIKLKAALALITSALYFFRKDFRLELGDGYELGNFTYDKVNGFVLKPTEKALAKEEDLKKEADPEYQNEVEQMSMEHLLNKDYTYRFKANEKTSAVSQFEEEEKDRKSTFNEQKDHEKMFYPIPIEDMKRYNHFINNRFNWEGINSNFKNVSKLPAPNLVTTSGNAPNEQMEKVQAILASLGNDLNVANAFVAHYKDLKDKIEEKKSIYGPSAAFDRYLKDLNTKYSLLEVLEEFKKDYLHSRRKTDEVLQKDSTDTSSILFKSNYENLKISYDKVSSQFSKDYPVIAEIKKIESDILTTLRAEFENKRKVKK